MFAAAGALVVAVATPNVPASAAAASVVDLYGGTTSVADFVFVSLATILLFASAIANMSSSGVTFSILFFCCRGQCVCCCRRIRIYT